MTKNVLITGGAGFIGSHLADELLRCGYRVRALDVLDPQVHPSGARPPYLTRDVDLVIGDVRDREAVDRALDGVSAVFHLAAAVGVGQSMYEIARYVSANDLGTAVLLERVIARRVERLVVASSMSIYGEGLYRDPRGQPHEAHGRSLEALACGEWELGGLTPVATPESKAVTLESIYALSKYDQERMCLLTGRAYGIRTTALRFFNVFGPRQALSNPYTGVLAIFAARLLNERRPLVFEDGRQQRDFVHVRDVARAGRLALEALEAGRADGRAINVGSGEPRTILEIARRMASALGKPHLSPEITGEYRIGDVRHCYADVSLARDLLGYAPEVDFEGGLTELAAWLADARAVDRTVEALAALHRRRLSRAATRPLEAAASARPPEGRS